jgi:nitrogen fixation protein FixH
MTTLPSTPLPSTLDNSRKPARGLQWPTFIVLLVLANMAVCAFTVYHATSDAGFYVEREYDQRALRWDDYARQLRHSEQLGWKLNITPPSLGASATLAVKLTDRDHRPLANANVRIEAFHPATAHTPSNLSGVTDAQGNISFTLPVTHAGNWEVRATCDAAGQRYFSNQIVYVDPDTH